MKRNFALTISFLFHPMIISLGVFSVLIFSSAQSNTNLKLILLTCFVFSNLIPIITVFVLKRTGKIDDLDASVKGQRYFPLMLGILYSGLGFSTLYILNANSLTQGLMFCYMTNTMLTLFITRFWKISIHSMGVSGPAAALWLSGNYFPISTAIIILLVGFSRVVLKAHTPSQVLAGSGLGFCSTFFQLHFLFL